MYMFFCQLGLPVIGMGAALHDLEEEGVDGVLGLRHPLPHDGKYVTDTTKKGIK